MRSILALWFGERRARWSFAAHLQGALGVGVALRVADHLLGPAFAAGVLLLTGPGGPELLLATNAATFIVSALLLTRLGGVRQRVEPTGETLLSDTRPGIRAVLGDRITRTLMCTSGAVVMVACTMNAAELVLAQRELGAGSSGFALLVCAYGCGLAGVGMLLVRLTAARGLRRTRPLLRPAIAAGV